MPHEPDTDIDTTSDARPKLSQAFELLFPGLLQLESVASLARYPYNSIRKERQVREHDHDRGTRPLPWLLLCPCGLGELITDTDRSCRTTPVVMQMGGKTLEMNAALSTAKQQLRSAMKQRLAAIPQDAVKEQSHVIHSKLLTFKPYMDARHISVFLSMPYAEVQTDEIVRHALASGKHVFVPYLHKSTFTWNPAIPARVMDMVRLKDVQDYESLERDKWGIPSIDHATIQERQRILGDAVAPNVDQATLDLILMPGVAFDFAPQSKEIRRLGHGRGFYDLFLERYAEKLEKLDVKGASVLLYGLGLKEQFLSAATGEVPVGPYDQPLHGLILGDGTTVVPDLIE